MIIVICAIGAYTVHNSMFDVCADAGLRRRRLRVQEARLPAGAAGAGAGAGRSWPRPASARLISSRRFPAGRQPRRGLVHRPGRRPSWRPRRRGWRSSVGLMGGVGGAGATQRVVVLAGAWAD
ncbi:MAG: tripartite tricarboxylate transporter permease [Comamonadaceae bacterium]|nr:tripartite tricarboxylate transporter permease [Comamonadaceae bacterium]